MKLAAGRARRSCATAQSHAVENARSGDGGCDGDAVAGAVSVVADALSVLRRFLGRASGASGAAREADGDGGAEGGGGAEVDGGAEGGSGRQGWAVRSSRIWAPSS